jgi:predicted nicotinamide N-methyase
LTAGFFLAEYMASNKELFNNKRCVELGSGIGLTGAVLMSVAQPSHTILTDYLDSVLANLETNIKINFPDTPESSNTTLPSWEAKRVDWEVDDVDSLNFDAEVIFAADVVRHCMSHYVAVINTN